MVVTTRKQEDDRKTRGGRPRSSFPEQEDDRRRRRRRPHLDSACISLDDFHDDDVDPYVIEPMIFICDYCEAKLFKREIKSARICCMNGTVELPNLQQVPDALKSLFINNSEASKEFQKNIRGYNCAFSCTSIGINLDHDLASSRKGIYTFRIQGQMYHRIKSLLPDNDHQDQPVYAQIYFQDS